MSTLSLPAVQSLVLEGIDWQTYTRLLRALDERPNIRLTYDRGSLEIMMLAMVEARGISRGLPRTLCAVF